MEWVDRAVHIGRHDGLLILVAVSVIASARLGHVVLGMVSCAWTVLQVFAPQPEWRVFVLWVAYGVIYWSLGVAVDELPVFLVVTTVAQVAIVLLHYVFSHALEKQGAPTAVLGLLLILPIHCNNLLYAPILALVRVVVYMVVRQERGATWLLEQYPLFAKSEILPFLVLVHVVARRYVRTTEPVVPMLPVHAPVVDAQSPAHAHAHAHAHVPDTPRLSAPKTEKHVTKLRPFYEHKHQ